jgi:hypothetical protein
MLQILLQLNVHQRYDLFHEHYRAQTNGRAFIVANRSSFNAANTNYIPEFLGVSA